MKLTTGPIKSHIRAIAVPASISFFFSTMLNIVDTYWAGFISTQALAALTLSFPLYFMILSFVSGLATGATALISNAVGAGDEKNIKLMTAQVLSFSICTYCILTPFCLWVSPWLFSILGASGDYLKMTVDFMNVIFIGSLFFYLGYSANSILLAHGNSRCMRNYSIGSCMLNFILDPWFLYGGFGLPPLGLRGIALATATVMFLGFFYMIYEVAKRGYLTDLKLSHFIPRLKIFGMIAKQSLPASLNLMMIGLRIFLVTYFVAFFGPDTVAGYGIGLRIEQFFLLPTIGLRIAALAIVAQNNGAKFLDRIRETINKSTLYGLALVSTGSILMIIIPENLAKIFSNKEPVIHVAGNYLWVMGWASWSYVFLSILEASLQGMKRPFFPFFAGIMRQIILPLGAFYLLAIEWGVGLNSLWWSLFAISWSFVLIVWLYLQRVLARRVLL